MISNDQWTQIFEEKKLAAQIWAKWAKIRLKTKLFCHFLKFGSLVFLETPDNDSLQQCITSSRGKVHGKEFSGPKIGQNQA